MSGSNAPAFVFGTQGWSYADWVGPMYEPQTRPDQYLRRYAEEFSSVEIDSTFYGTPDPRRIARWKTSVPDGFAFALKLPREITHERRLLACEALSAEFFTAASGLGEKLGCVLVQFPADFPPAELPALQAFLPLVPTHVRCAVEFRDPGWLTPEVLALLEAHGVALALTDGTFIARERMLALLAQPTADFTYLRWLGTRDAVDRFGAVSIDRTREIGTWRAALKTAPPRLRTVYGYVNNHYQGHAPATVRTLYEALGIAHRRPARIVQPSLFGPQPRS